ncbi:hypothetical protein [Chitinophaga sp. YIM B06452]|uniref:hypothetical protein n=1 Tax=Chitinophaga sp. YIM B06452 TaxID=3082158 RepID=UPI0031FEACC4
MLTDPAQENIFQEEEFTDVRYRETLMPLWLKLLIGLGVFSSFMSGAVIAVVFFAVERNKGAADIITVFAMASLFLAGGIAGIQMFREKKWAIYGITASALLHLLIYGVGVVQFRDMFKNEEARSLMIPMAVIVFVLLIFLIKILLIFKRWLAYHPSVKPKR